ncbi:MAG: metal (Ni/Fe) hydrogenase large subunit [Leptospiraceae bacterium]|nr:metal (Ni/Fe) hydrogenase large subunit [Leptospiraceae bacterium]
MKTKALSYNAITGIFQLARTGDFYSFTQSATNTLISLPFKTTISDLLKDPKYPLWLLRHSLGIESEELEDYTKISNYKQTPPRERDIFVAVDSKGDLKNLNYRGLKVPVDAKSYAHAVGPIHAGIIEPGHFRFYVTGEIIQTLHIRLGFQHRGVQKLLKGKSPIEAMPIAESIASDSTISYALAFAECFEQAMKLEVSQEVQLFRLILLEVERMAIHIADLGAIASDIGYYPLHGLCATDRGVPLGVMETLTGSRFGKGCIYPGEVRVNDKLVINDIPIILKNLRLAFNRIEKQFYRAYNSTTFHERLENCGTITREDVIQNGFVGMAARCTGIVQDQRLSNPLYLNTNMTLWLEDYQSELNGDALSRFFLRFIELKHCLEWLEKVLKHIKIPVKNSPLLCLNHKKFKEGLYYSTVEGWRGPVLVCLDIDSKGKIREAYIRDPSVLNWHALELAVRGELIGDFPLNNKSFNLSYVGVDL